MTTEPGDVWYNSTGQFTPVDTSNLVFPKEIWGSIPKWEAIVKAIVLLTIVVIGLTGNGSLIYTIMRTKGLQTTTNLLILNMAIADFCTCLLCPGVFLVTDAYQEFALTEAGCKIDAFLPQALTLVSVICLSVVSYDRVCAIVFDCSGKLSTRNARMLICASWLAAFAATMPLSYFRNYFERTWKNHVEKFCGVTDTAMSYWHIFVGISVWVPLAIMGVCYTMILIKLDRYETYALKSKHPIVVRYKGRVAKILALVLLSFTVCRLPFTVLVITSSQLKNSKDLPMPPQTDFLYALWFLSRLLLFVNAAINPYLYGCTSAVLRQEMTSYPPLKWIMPAKKSAELHHRINENHQQKKLQPRSPCIGMNDTVNQKSKDAIPNISSTVQSKSKRTLPAGPRSFTRISGFESSVVK